MRQHRNPYRINDPNNIFEVAENSSHPELKDKYRLYKYKGRIFRTATEAQKFLDNEGIDVKRLKLVPVRHLDADGSVIIICNLAERVPQGMHDIRDLERYG